MNVGNSGNAFATCAGLKASASRSRYVRRDGDRKPLEKKLKDVYGADQEPKSDAELRELARNIERGVPVATPVFTAPDTISARC